MSLFAVLIPSFSGLRFVLWLSAAGATDPQRDALGLGYRAGLTLEMREPAKAGEEVG